MGPERKRNLDRCGTATPESAELEYPATEAVHEMRRNIYERLLAYEMITNKDGVRVENFDKLTGALAESWDVAPDSKSITFHLRPAKAGNGDVLTADDVMWTFDRGWHLKATFYWYMTQVLKISDYGQAFHKLTTTPYRSRCLSVAAARPALGQQRSGDHRQHRGEKAPDGG